jgi:hypothetical protein
VVGRVGVATGWVHLLGMGWAVVAVGVRELERHVGLVMETH